MTASPSDSGLQAERTGLAWARTSIAAAANGVLLSVREIHHGWSPLTLASVVVALAITTMTVLYGRRRSDQLRHAPLPDPLAARRAIHALGCSAVVLAVLSGIAVIL